VRSRTYEIIFSGQAGPAVAAEFDDCEVIPGAGTTTLRAELPDQCALSGLIQRIIGLHLEITRVQVVSPDNDGQVHQAGSISGHD
jgi:hypothetical protein